ncbi:PDF receptor-like [Saccostrea echinata]|uniref:PDF receptor-like n=1 Tax=Saccostrea echinata TaxID=191078 RepID=UPI002A83105A|nr:PDF receptor-like [Saccostrea echinata]
MNFSLGGVFSFFAITNNSLLFENSLRKPWKYRSEIDCIQTLETEMKTQEASDWCQATWDTILCWPPVPPGQTVYMACPPYPGLDPQKMAFRRCGCTSRWEGPQPLGYSNYTECYTPESRRLMAKFYGNKSAEDRQLMKKIVVGTRTMEIIGLCVSLVSCLTSLFIFCYFRALRCHRTRIHRNLLVAIIVQIIIRLVLYIDQYIARERQSDYLLTTGSYIAIFHTPTFCETIYTLLEYTVSVQFMWMFVEGIHLHNIIAVSFFSGKPNYFVYYILGWGTPIPFTVAWVITMLDLHQNSCWFPYYFLTEYWIIEAPRVTVIGVNLLFLLNIIRVLVHKLRKTRTLEPQLTKVRKAVKAAIVLLPLLGITNAVNLIDPPADSVVHFGLWSYSTYFLVSFQGFFISLLYCYTNGEVQAALKKHWSNYLESKSFSGLQAFQNRRSCSVVTSSFDLTLNQRILNQVNKKSPLIRMKSTGSAYTESMV